MTSSDDDDEFDTDLNAPERARNEGYQAAGQGAPDTACPYSSGILREAWLGGHQQYRYERERGTFG